MKNFLKKIHLFYLPNRINRMKHFALLITYLILPIILLPACVAFDSIAITILYMLFSLAAVINHIILHIKRLHDFDYSGIWVLLIFVPLIGFFWFLTIALKRGTDGENRFGKKPPKASKLFYIIFWTFMSPILIALGCSLCLMPLSFLLP